ncbi:MAG: class I SAM-dependent methyltransferase [Sulfitobacter sp.]|nr:class I SAM-dependent methyltransferase [Sulfitobacter sp.]
MTDAETLSVYAHKAAEYEAVTGHAVSEDPVLKKFISALPPGSDVLDLGCGPGLCAAAIAAAGHRVTATDAVPEMVARAKKHAGVTAQLATFDQIEAEEAYDGVWANFSLLHAARDAMPRHLVALQKALKSGGLFHIALKSGQGSKRDSLGRLYTYYTEDELAALLREAGFTVTDRFSGKDKGLDGSLADWIALHAHA